MVMCCWGRGDPGGTVDQETAVWQRWMQANCASQAGGAPRPDAQVNSSSRVTGVLNGPDGQAALSLPKNCVESNQWRRTGQLFYGRVLDEESGQLDVLP